MPSDSRKYFVPRKSYGPLEATKIAWAPLGSCALVVLEFQQAEQIAADGGWRDQRRHEFDIEIVARAERPVEPGTGRARIGERRRNLARGHPPSHHRALGEELVPGLDAEALEIEGRNVTVATAVAAVTAVSGHSGARGARAQHQPGGGEDRGAHGARADGCTGDVVRRQRVGAAAQRPAGFAGKKRVELALAHGVVNDHRLLVEDDLGPRDAAAEIDAGDDVERCRRIAGRRDDVEGRKHIGDNLVALEDRDRRRRAFLRSRGVRRRDRPPP